MTQRLEVENYLGKFEVVIDRGGQVLDAVLSEDASWVTMKLHRERNPPLDDGQVHVFGSETPVDACLFKSAAHFSEYLGAQADFIPAAALLAKAKQVDDRIIMTVERMVSRGYGERMGKREFVRVLAEAVHTVSLVASNHFAEHDDSEGLPPSVGTFADDFLKDPLRSKALGFYTKDKELRRIFRADRILQGEFAKEDAAKVMLAIEKHKEDYLHFIDILKLTNPLSEPHILEGGNHLFPASKSPETELVKKLYGNAPVPEGFDLIKELITRARDGRLDLDPTVHDGWYAHQIYALSALLTPQRASLSVDAKYQDKLDELFAAALAATRETHVKQLEMALAGAAMPAYIHSPCLRLSPLPELYERVSKSYRTLFSLLETRFADEMTTPFADLQGRSLTQEVNEMVQLFERAAEASKIDLGEIDYADVSLDFDLNDEDLKADARFMVPIYKDLQRNTIRVRAFIGYEAADVDFSFQKRPEVRLSQIGSPNEEPTKPTLLQRLTRFKNPDAESPKKVQHFNSKVEATFHSQNITTLFPVSIEVDVRALLDRKEFQALCDREGTQKNIVAALKAL